ncbi:MAG: L,D-transpeptidase [Solirubrobacteraceae bacterium]
MALQGTKPKASMRRGATIALVAALTAATPATATAQTSAAEPGQTDDAAAVPAPGVLDPMATLTKPGDALRLSDEKTVTRWAHATDVYPIRTEPRAGARTITRLRYFTEDRRPEVYLVLGGRLDAQGRPWLHIRIPMRPNGREGWVPADRLGSLKVVRTSLVIDRASQRATLTKNGRVVWRARVGLGRAISPTPRGKFWVRELLRGDGRVYGPWAFGTSAYSNLSDWPKGGVVGIHGTNQPGLIPGRPSHGCVRVRNKAIRALVRLMPIGTPIEIVN